MGGQVRGTGGGTGEGDRWGGQVGERWVDRMGEQGGHADLWVTLGISYFIKYATMTMDIQPHILELYLGTASLLDLWQPQNHCCC